MKIIKGVIFFMLFVLSNIYGQEYKPYYPFDLKPYYDKETKLWGYKKNGEIVISAQFGFVSTFSEKGFARVRNRIQDKDYEKNGIDNDFFYGTIEAWWSNIGHDGIIDTLGNIVIPVEFGVIGDLKSFDIVQFTKGNVRELSSGEIDPVYRTEKYGLINNEGKIILEPTYDAIFPYSNHIYAAETITSMGDIGNVTGVKRTYIGSDGKDFVESGKFDYFYDMFPFFYVEKNGMVALIDLELEIVIPYEKITNRKTDFDRLLKIAEIKEKEYK